MGFKKRYEPTSFVTKYLLPSFPCIMFMKTHDNSMRWCSSKYFEECSLFMRYMPIEENKEYMRLLRKLKIERVKGC